MKNDLQVTKTLSRISNSGHRASSIDTSPIGTCEARRGKRGRGNKLGERGKKPEEGERR